MIILKAINDTEAGFDCELHIEGEKMAYSKAADYSI